MDFNKYKFRAHSTGHIMGGIPKPLTDNQQELYDVYTARKNGEGRPLTDNQLADWGDLHKRKNAKVKLSDPAKKHLEKLFWEQITGRSKEITAKYLDKGIQCEEKSFTLHSDATNKLFIKNQERKTNRYFTGECDNAQHKTIRDIKTSWEYSTFPLREDKIPNEIYQWQLDVYMDLWGFKKSELIYCLVDTPYRLINDETRRLDWKHDILDNAGDVRENAIPLVVETVCNHIYTIEGLEQFCQQSTNIYVEWFEGVFREIPEEIRVKIFHYKYCEKRNKLLKEMVVLARDYMNSLLNDMGDSVLKLTEGKLLKSA